MSMGMSQTQRQTLKQQLVISQQQLQALGLLQLNQMELVAAIEQELAENPTLEENNDEGDEGPTEAEARMEEGLRNEQAEITEQQNGQETSQDRQDLERLLERFESSQEDPQAGRQPTRFDDLPPIETTLKAGENLTQHLLSQVGMLHCTPGEQRAAICIIYNLDRNGFLEMTVAEVAAEAEVDLDDAEGALEIVQGLDPVGCGAKDSLGSLAIQAQKRWPEDPYVLEIIERHMKALENRNYAQIARAIDQEVEDVLEYHKMIQELEPRPGLPYADEPDQFVSADVNVVKQGDRWTIEQNEDGLPKLRMSSYYKDIVTSASSKEAKGYVKERLEAAEFLIKTLYKRERTINRTVNTIIERQQEFFEQGPAHLKPMILRDIADEIGVHESTISRVTSGKYLQCPHGLFELKYFFNAGIQRTSGGDLAGEAVKNRIRKLISEEDRKKPLSDQDIVDLLAKDDIEIARRTVAKYREAMNILPGNKRKKSF
jgi:RNA polymerase sigma-54 factor